MWGRAGRGATGRRSTQTLEQQEQTAEQEWHDTYRRGPARLRWTKLPPQPGDRAPDLELQDMTGRFVHLREFWRERPALLLFWRQYGCGCGIERASRLQQEYQIYRDAGADVVIIGQGEPKRASAYARKYNLPPCPILCDPTFRAYQAYGLLEGTPIQVTYDAPEEIWRGDLAAAMQLAGERHAAGRPFVDDPWQLPGEFVIRPGGVIALAYRYQYCDNFAHPLLLTVAIREAAGRAPSAPTA
jgi:peroxiredoxin